MKKQKVFVFTVSRPIYSGLLREELAGIRRMIGDFDVIKVCEKYFGDMKIWVTPKNKDSEILDGIVSIMKQPGYDENLMYDIEQLLKKYGKI